MQLTRGMLAVGGFVLLLLAVLNTYVVPSSAFGPDFILEETLLTAAAVACFAAFTKVGKKKSKSA